MKLWNIVLLKVFFMIWKKIYILSCTIKGICAPKCYWKLQNCLHLEMIFARVFSKYFCHSKSICIIKYIFIVFTARQEIFIKVLLWNASCTFIILLILIRQKNHIHQQINYDHIRKSSKLYILNSRGRLDYSAFKEKWGRGKVLPHEGFRKLLFGERFYYYVGVIF